VPSVRYSTPEAYSTRPSQPPTAPTPCSSTTSRKSVRAREIPNRYAPTITTLAGERSTPGRGGGTRSTSRTHRRPSSACLNACHHAIVEMVSEDRVSCTVSVPKVGKGRPGGEEGPGPTEEGREKALADEVGPPACDAPGARRHVMRKTKVPVVMWIVVVCVKRRSAAASVELSTLNSESDVSTRRVMRSTETSERRQSRRLRCGI
jgi:hypothetical protein